VVASSSPNVVVAPRGGSSAVSSMVGDARRAPSAPASSEINHQPSSTAGSANRSPGGSWWLISTS
jgi:hypothetical protein